MLTESRIQVIEHFEDPMWRINNLYYCVNERGKKVPFRLRYAQEKLLKDLWWLNIVLKSRQHGFTTLIAILGLDTALFEDNHAIGFTAHGRDEVEKIFSKKVKFPYDCLPEGLKQARQADTNTAKMLKFSNGSTIEVGLSLRSGTYQFVHISEFGKLCARFPMRAQEVVTGTLEAVHEGGLVFIESTAEGNGGYFYDYCMDALRRKQQGTPLNTQQYKLHFFPWFEDPKNQMNPKHVVVSEEDQQYFEQLGIEHGIQLSEGQKAWWAEKHRKLGEKVFQEHPSTPEEAFKSSVEGSYLSKQMAHVRKNGQICVIPVDETIPVNTGWDLGINDEMTIWFHQRDKFQDKLIDYYENTGYGLGHYVKIMQDKGYIYGNHFLPHDGGQRRMSKEENPSTVQKQLYELGLRNLHIIPRTPIKVAAINESRKFLHTCYFDNTRCDKGIKCLDNFRREWDEDKSTFNDSPLHDWAMHGYDGFESLARGIFAIGPGIVGDNNMQERQRRSGRRQPPNWKVGR